MPDNQASGAAPKQADRRQFLGAAGKFAVVAPPVMTMLLATSMNSPAIAASGTGGGGGGGGGDDALALLPLPLLAGLGHGAPVAAAPLLAANTPPAVVPAGAAAAPAAAPGQSMVAGAPRPSTPVISGTPIQRAGERG